MQRRTFLRSVSATLAGTLVGGQNVSSRADESRGVQRSATNTSDARKTYRVGIIGSTGRGDYGHALDGVWSKVPGVQIVAVADADAQGREAAGKRLQVDKLYDDYRQMLAREKFDVVCVCPRWLDQREEMITAVAGAGCHIFCEKPFAVDAASADRMLAACRSAGVKVAVAHPQRATPGTREIQARLADGRLGKLLSWRACGKEDHRAGGEDMMVLGCHTFDLMSLLAGSPRWAFS
jgi:predicted dehydrogenase